MSEAAKQIIISQKKFISFINKDKYKNSSQYKAVILFLCIGYMSNSFVLTEKSEVHQNQ